LDRDAIFAGSRNLNPQQDNRVGPNPAAQHELEIETARI
jgi:hypothetical protein